MGIGSIRGLLGGIRGGRGFWGLSGDVGSVRDALGAGRECRY